MTNIDEDNKLDSNVNYRKNQIKIKEPDFNSRFFKSDEEIEIEEEHEDEEE